MPTSQEEKSRLRQEYSRLRQDLPLREQESAAGQVAERLVDFAPVKACRDIGMYWPIRGELGTGECFFILKSLGYRIFFPKISSEPPVGLQFAEILDPQKLVSGPYGILEPPASVSIVHLDRIPVLLIPGVVFDRQGNRIGWGKGYYDRLLSGYTGVKVGLAYEFQILDSLPQEKGDEPMDFLVTEQSVFECRPEVDYAR